MSILHYLSINEGFSGMHYALLENGCYDQVRNSSW